jgi:hypothetical protein
MWEYQTFLDFLEDKHSKDELYYFLHIRNMIFKGPQMKDSSSTYARVHFLPLEDVYEMLELVFTKADPEDLALAKNKIAKFGKDACGKTTMIDKEKTHVDSAKVLRIMFEFYREEKQIRCYLLS